MIYVLSDIKGHYHLFYRVIDQLGNLKPFEGGENKLVILGNLIGNGSNSYKVVNLIFSLQQSIGFENNSIIVLKGALEDWFLNFLDKNVDEWLAEDRKLQASKTFLNDDQIAKVNKMISNGHLDSVYTYI